MAFCAFLKKLPAGSTHVVIDIPVGAYCQMRNIEMAKAKKDHIGNGLADVCVV